MTVPVLSAELAPLRDFLRQLDDRLTNLETPNQPNGLYKMASTSLTTSNAKTYVNCPVYCYDLNQIAYSNGVHWYKLAVGSLIV